MRRRFVRGSVGSGVALAGRAGAALLLNKLMAVYGGPGALTLLAHFQNLLGLFTTLPNDGTHVGLVKYLAPLHPQGARYKAWLGAAILLNAGALLLGGLVVVFLPGPFVGVFQPTPFWVALLCLGVALLTAYALVVTVLLAAGQLRAYVAFTLVQSVLGVGAVAVAFRARASVNTTLLAYLLAQSLALVPAVALALRRGMVPSLRGRVSRSALRGLSLFLLMGLGLLLFGKAVDFSVREILIREFSLARTDLWQAVSKLSDNYTMVLAAAMSSVYYPRLAALASQPAAQRLWVRMVVRLVAILAGLGLVLVFLLRDWLLSWLFDAHFAPARDLFVPQLLSDWLRFVAWPLMMIFTVRAQVTRYVLTQVGVAVSYAAALVWLLPRYGLLGPSMANAFSHGCLVLWCVWSFRSFWRS